MSAKQQLAEAIAELPDSLSISEAVERLYRSFKLKQAHERAMARPAQDSPLLASKVSQIRQLLDEERIAEGKSALPVGILCSLGSLPEPEVAVLDTAAARCTAWSSTSSLRTVMIWRWMGRAPCWRTGSVRP